MNSADYAKAKKLLLEAGVLKRLEFRADGLEIIKKMEQKASAQGLFVLTNALMENVLAETEKHFEPVAVQKSALPEDGFKPQLKILPFKKYDCTGGVDDFVAHFKNRLEKLDKILKNRNSENGVMTIERAKGALDRRRTRIIGMVDSHSETKNGNMKFNLEDETGMVNCIAVQDKPVFQQAKKLWLDEVIGVDGFYSNNGLFIAENIIWPEIPMRQKKLCNEDVCIAFMSDLHVGSRYFLKEKFEKAIAFLNGNPEDEENRPITEKIRYLIIAGDLVDGIGVYPTQEKQLVTKDVYEQYKLLGEYLKSIPPRIQVVLAPGNHDAVRDAEPQPPIPGEFTELFQQPNFHFVPNPCWLDIHGIRVMVYHGTSTDALISNSENMGDAFDHPEKIAVEMLRRRHLCPLYGEKPIIPSREDGMVIEEVPDIFHFGHMHNNCADNYNGTLVINSGTWQGTTDYQEKMGRKPTPGLMPVYNIKTGSLKIVDFNGE